MVVKSVIQRFLIFVPRRITSHESKVIYLLNIAQIYSCECIE